MRLFVTLVFLSALGVFLWSGLQYLMSRLARPLDQHRHEHDRIQSRLGDLERRLGPAGRSDTDAESRRQRGSGT